MARDLASGPRFLLSLADDDEHNISKTLLLLISSQEQLFVGNRAVAQNPLLLSLHINNNYARKSGIGKKFLHTIRAKSRKSTLTWWPVFSTDQPGASQSGTTPQLTSVLEEAFADTDFPVRPGLPPLFGPGAMPGEWTDVCGFVKQPKSRDVWKIRPHVAFTIPRETLGLRQRDQSCHHEVWQHLDLVSNRYAHEEITSNVSSSRKGPVPTRPPERNVGIESDHSLSSLSSVRELVLP